MAQYDNYNFDEVIAAYLRTKGYTKTLNTFLTESSCLRGRNVESIGNSYSTASMQMMEQFLRGNSNAYAMVTTAVHQLENAVSSLKSGLRLTDQRQNGSISMQRRFYTNHSTARHRTSIFEANGRQQGSVDDLSSGHVPTAVTYIVTGPANDVQFDPSTSQNPPTTPTSHGQNQRDLRVANEIVNATTPTRRQLYSSPSKRKTPNPKHQATPVVERDLLEEALKLCAISPSDWDRRVSDSAVPVQLAAAINNAKADSTADAPTQPEKSPTPPPNLEKSGEKEDSVVSGTLYQIGTNPGFFQSLEQLFAPGYNDPNGPMWDDDVNGFGDLNATHDQSDYILDESSTPAGLQMVLDTSTGTPITTGTMTGHRTSPFKRILPKPATWTKSQPPIPEKGKRRSVVARPLFPNAGGGDGCQSEPRIKRSRILNMDPLEERNQFSVGSGSIEDGPSGGDSSAKSKQSTQNRYPSADTITPDRIDALMKRLHKKS